MEFARAFWKFFGKINFFTLLSRFFCYHSGFDPFFYDKLTRLHLEFFAVCFFSYRHAPFLYYIINFPACPLLLYNFPLRLRFL